MSLYKKLGHTMTARGHPRTQYSSTITFFIQNLIFIYLFLSLIWIQFDFYLLKSRKQFNEYIFSTHTIFKVIQFTFTN